MCSADKLLRSLGLPFITLLAATACGGGGGGGGSDAPPPPPPVEDASPGGIWSGPVAFSTGEVYEAAGVVTELGFFRFFDEQGQQLFGQLTVSGTSVTGRGNWALELGDSTPAGSTFGTVTLSGTIVERSRMTGSFTSTGDQGDRFSGTISFNYDPLYDRDSSLSTISGTYISDGEVLTIDSQGRVFSQDPGTDCVLNGLVSIIDARYNAYNIGFEIANCTGQEAILNGLDFNGLAVLDNSFPPDDVLIFQVDGEFLGGIIVATEAYLKQ